MKVVYLNVYPKENIVFFEYIIYISCKPTGKSTETTEVEISKPTWGNMWTPSDHDLKLVFTVLGIVIIVLVVFYLIFRLFGMITPTKLKPTSPPVAADTGFFTSMASMFSFS